VAPLDGFRALAMLWVVSLHSYQFMPYTLSLSDEERASYDHMLNSVAMRPVLTGDLGVDIFFILSGYLIMAILTKELAPHVRAGGSNGSSSSNDPSLQEPLINNNSSSMPQRSLAGTVGAFFLRRYLRIMPAYAFAIVFQATAELMSPAGPVCLKYFWRNLLFIQNFFPEGEMCMAWSWSIAVEWQMYMVSPLIVWAALRWPHWAKLQMLAYAAVSIILYMALTPYALGSPDTDTYFELVYAVPYTRMYGYVFGMLLFLVMSERKTAATNDNTAAIEQDDDVPQQPRPASTSRLALVLRVLSIVVIALTCFSAPTQGLQSWGWFVARRVLTRPIFTAAMSYVIYDAIQANLDAYEAFVVRILDSRLLFVLAQVSYSMYLLHPMLGGLYILFGSVPFVPQWLYPVVLILILTGTFALAVLVYFAIEKPMINIGNQKTRPAVAPPTTLPLAV